MFKIAVVICITVAIKVVVVVVVVVDNADEQTHFIYMNNM